MTMQRFDMYSLVHKGQRKKLFELTIAAGQLATEDAATHDALAADVDATLAAIADHAEAEEAFFGPIYRDAAPATGARLAADHDALDGEMARVRAAAATALEARSPATGLALHRALARFTSTYLAHVDAEEESLVELWAAVDDATLARAQGALVASHPPSSVRFNLRNMLPAASPAERVAFLASLRRNMPPAAFAGVRELVGELVPASEWSRVEAS
jgi:hypothetical protein